MVPVAVPAWAMALELAPGQVPVAAAWVAAVAAAAAAVWAAAAVLAGVPAARVVPVVVADKPMQLLTGALASRA